MVCRNNRREVGQREAGASSKKPEQQGPAEIKPRGQIRPRTHTAKKSQKTDDYGPPVKSLEAKGIDFAKGFVGQLIDASAAGAGKIDRDKFLFSLSVIKGVEPKDQLDVMLLAQMAEIHAAMMKTAGKFAQAENIALFDSLGRALNQLARTYATQIETFRRCREGAAKVAVQSVSVTDGGQAIVGNVTQVPRGSVAVEPAKATPELIDARQTPMKIIGEPQRAAIPLPRKRKG